MKIIISNTDVGALIKAADKILQKYAKDAVPENIKGQAVLSVLKNMTQRKEWFDVTAVRELAKLNEITISAEHMELFHSLHCIHWNEMHSDTREYLLAVLSFRFVGRRNGDTASARCRLDRLLFVLIVCLIVGRIDGHQRIIGISALISDAGRTSTRVHDAARFLPPPSIVRHPANSAWTSQAGTGLLK